MDPPYPQGMLNALAVDPKLMPFTRGLLDTLAPPRQAAVAAELPRPALPPGSLHAPQTEATETLMVGTMQDLRVDAVEKQRELEEQLAAVQARRDAALERLTGTIIPQREARLSRQRAAMEAALASLDAELAGAITSVFVRHDFTLRHPSARMEQRVLAEEEFYFREVPLQFEAQCRASVNTMEGERQALQLNNATVRCGCWWWWGVLHSRLLAGGTQRQLTGHHPHYTACHSHTLWPPLHHRSTPGSAPLRSAWTATSGPTSSAR